MNNSLQERRFALFSGLSCILGVILLVVSFSINPGPPAGATGAELARFGHEHYAEILWGAWLQAVGPVFIVLFAFTLVHLAGAANRLAGWMTLLGATALMTVSLIEVTFYAAALWDDPPMLPSISMRLIYAVQHLYFVVGAPALFLPLGIVIVGSRVLPRMFGYLAFAIAAAFAAAGIVFLLTLRLSDAVTELGAIQPLWWLAAAVTLMVRSGKIPPRERSSSSD